MKFSVTLFVAVVSLATTAVDAQGESDPNCFAACTALSKTTSKCGYDLAHSMNDATSDQQLCMCKAKGFVSDYQS